MSPSEVYLEKATGILDAVRGQLATVRQAADRFAATILAGRMVHVFGSGH
ncbi:MAG TPA: SIS domain-containing protein, partial [Verrucomicrobiales bacterium]|nr:SIS domain-containing protein [Verrucomicrobiales bacterium]